MKKRTTRILFLILSVITFIEICGCKNSVNPVATPSVTQKVMITTPPANTPTAIPTEAPTEAPAETPTTDPMAQYVSNIEVATEYDAITQRILVTITNHSPYFFSGEVVIYISNTKDYHKSEIVPIEVVELEPGVSSMGYIDFKLTDEYRIKVKIESYSFIEKTQEAGEEDKAFADAVKATMFSSFGMTSWGPELKEYKAFKLDDGSYRIEVILGNVPSDIYQAIAMNIFRYSDSISEVILLDSDGNTLFSKSE